ncbi:SYF1 factor, partial [Daphoenositta chrysoptera]|nr:SYF1 factor [Daphoenositta chrysoptera]
EEEEVQHEEELLRNPFSVRGWLRYAQARQRGPRPRLNQIYERALRELPGSYKLWYQYLRQRRAQVKGRCPSDPAFEEANAVHERALMPRIWLDYCQFLAEQGRITRTRRTFDRALRALPITQHRRLWPQYLGFVRKHPLPETAVRVFRRFLKLGVTAGHLLVQVMLRGSGDTEVTLAVSPAVPRGGQALWELWQELCELLSQHPDRVRSLDAGGIIRGGLTRFTDQRGRLWGALADCYVRCGHLEKARDVYEEAVQTVMTVRDFTQVFDSYARFEESVIAALLDTQAQLGRGQDGAARAPRTWGHPKLGGSRDTPNLGAPRTWGEQEHPKRPGEHCWGQPGTAGTWGTPRNKGGHPETEGSGGLGWSKVEGTLKVGRSPKRAPGWPWLRLGSVRGVVGRCGGAWGGFGDPSNSFFPPFFPQKATALPAKRAEYFDSSEPVQNRLYKSLRVWSMLADLEESLGTFQSTRAVYERILDLRIATPQIVINYALLLEEHGRFEDSFKAYERGIALFRWPHVGDLWLTYLSKFVARYGGRKLERARDLFEQALDGCPPQHAKTIYLLYARLEEQFGLARRAMAVYERGTRAVPPAQQRDMFHIYIRRAAELFGVTHTRPIYQRAIEVLGDDAARELCLRFADMECKLGEVDRARAIYTYCSQICDPRITGSFWQTWKEFEIRHGNEDTIREMLRIKRSVQATYNTQVNFMASQMLKVSGSATGT